MADQVIYHTALGASKVFQAVDKNISTTNGIPTSLSSVSYNGGIYLAGISGKKEYIWRKYDPSNPTSSTWAVAAKGVQPSNDTAQLVVLDNELYFAYVPEDKKVLSWWKYDSGADAWAPAPQRTGGGTLLPAGQDLAPAANFSIFEYDGRLWLVGPFPKWLDKSRAQYSTYDLGSASATWTKPSDIMAKANTNFYTDWAVLAEPYQQDGVTFVGRYKGNGAENDSLLHLVFDKDGQTDTDTLFDSLRHTTSNLAGGVFNGLLYLVYGDQQVANKSLVYVAHDGVSWSRPTALLDQAGVTSTPKLVSTVAHAGEFHVFYTR